MKSASTDEILTFVRTFARFEYSLKAAGYLCPSEDDAKPDWERYGRTISGEAFVVAPEDVHASVTYFVAAPPQKQVAPEGRLRFVPGLPTTTPGSAVWLITMIRRVRNNLFHGGKEVRPDQLNPERDRLLICHAVTILNHFLGLKSSRSVATRYRAD